MSSLKFTINLCFILLFTLIAHESAMAQSEEYKIEAGVQLSVLGRNSGRFFDNPGGLGVGGRVTVDLTKHLAVEGEMNYFPGSGSNNTRSFQGQFGVKSGVRFQRFGLFGKVRPGFINARSEFATGCSICRIGSVCILPPCFAVPIVASETRASLDVGGIIEFYPLKRITVRFDVGDTIINRAYPRNNLQVSAGVGYRF
jgi:outer membrane protein with beta-barrel domain